MDAPACNRFAPANSILVEGLSMNKGFDSRLNQGWRASADDLAWRWVSVQLTKSPCRSSAFPQKRCKRYLNPNR